LPIAGLPPALAGRRIVQLSDLHAGAQVDSDYLINCMERASNLQPDFTVITGDFMSCHGFEQIETVARVVGHLRPGPLGCFAILGNHDYALGWARSEVADQLAVRLSKLGVRVLRNEIALVEGLQLVGVDDFWGTNFNPATVLPVADPTRPLLTLSHNPDTVDLPAFAHHPGWVLSGHTHGGQCKPPFLTPPLLPVQNRRYTSGEFALSNGRHLYISRGVGHLLRVRFNARPEITAFRLCGG
jgi:uncharacterized protein